METINADTFHKSVTRCFEPIARERGWPLVHTSEDTCEIQASHLNLKIRFRIGRHSRNIDAVLVDPRLGRGNPNSELGIFAIAAYNGVNIQFLPSEQTEQGFYDYAQYVAEMTRTFGLPYLLGQKGDWNAVREHWLRETDKEIERIKNYSYPPSVQKRWHLPPPPEQDSETK